MMSEKQKNHLDRVAKLRTGSKHSKETIEKMSITHKNRFQKGFIPWNKGKTMSDEYKKKLSEYHLINGPKGKDCYNWKGGSWIYWQKQIKKRDNYTCQVCGLREKEIVVAAHIVPIKGKRLENGHELNSYENLITLCPNCHARYDKKLIKINKKI